ncbi:MAG: hypothetical protein U0X73_10505 [Thermoanaerobaculia bacterium]
MGTYAPNRRGFRLFRLGLADLRTVELSPDSEAQGQMWIESEPAIGAAVWSADGAEALFPTFSIRHGFESVSPSTTGQLHQFQPSVPARTAWYRVSLRSAGGGTVEILDPRSDRQPPIDVPPRVDPALRFRQTTRGGFDLLDHERGDRKIRSFGGWLLGIDPDTATVSPTGEWIGLTISTENFGNKGTHAYLVRRDGGASYYLSRDVSGLLQFHPRRAEVFGVAQDIRRADWVLRRWRFEGR